VPFVKATGNMILAPGVTEEEGHGHKGHHHAYDPHVWLSPKRAIKLVENIRDALSKKFPRRAKIFKKNAANYIDKLQTLDKEYAVGLANAKQKSFVTQHAAFGYLALDYGLTQIPITGLTAESEPSAKRLAELSKYVKEYGINYIYFEENASSAVSKTLADEAGVKTAVLSPLESLTQKQMDTGENYFSVMRANLKALKKTTDSAGKEIKPEMDSDKTVANGYFKDKSVKNRKLSDWSGKWQSIYPYLENRLNISVTLSSKSDTYFSAFSFSAFNCVFSAVNCAIVCVCCSIIAFASLSSQPVTVKSAVKIHRTFQRN